METKRLRIRPLTAEDTEELCKVLSDAEVMRYVEAPYSRQQTAEFIQRVNMAVPPLAYAVVWKETDRVIGHLIFHPYDDRSWELGWILRRDYWRRGLADELTGSVIADAQQRGLPALVIECHRDQLVTRHIAEKNGFRYVGEEDGLVIYRRTIRG